MPTGASWGSGGFTVRQAGALSLANVVVPGVLTVQAGGTLSLSNVTYGEQHYGLRISKADGAVVQGGEAQAQAQCSQPYTTLRDSWRSTGTGKGKHGDCSKKTGVGGGRWYRFAGAGGDALPLTSPGKRHCGTV